MNNVNNLQRVWLLWRGNDKNSKDWLDGCYDTHQTAMLALQRTMHDWEVVATNYNGGVYRMNWRLDDGTPEYSICVMTIEQRDIYTTEWLNQFVVTDADIKD